MSVGRRLINLGFCPHQVVEGQHICYIYNDDAERCQVIAKYLEQGLLEGEKVLYLVDDMTPEAMLERLADLGVDVLSKVNDLTIRDAASTYCSKGVFKPEDMLKLVELLYHDSIDQGYAGARGSGEMSWSLVEGRTNVEELMEYEANLNHLLKLHPVTACCQYDSQRFDGETIMDILSVHPYVIIRGQLVSNPYYIEPDLFLEEFRKRKRK